MSQGAFRPSDINKRFPLPNRVLSAAPLASEGLSPLTDARAAIVDDLPQSLTLTCGFNQLPTSVVNNGFMPAWTDLMVVSADDFGQDLLLLGATFEQLAADTTGAAATGGTAARPWGDRFGRGAGLAIAQDMTEARRDGGWYERVFPDPSFGYPNAATWDPLQVLSGAVQSGYADKVLYSLGWPVGSLGDTLPYQRLFTKSFAPSGFRLIKGHTLHVAFVVAPNRLDPNVTGVVANFYGHCRVQLHFAKTEGDFAYVRK